MCINSAGWALANSKDLDQMSHSAVFDEGLHCLIRPVCPNTKTKFNNYTPHKLCLWGYTVFILSVHPSVYSSIGYIWFLLLFFLNNLRNLYISCINVDIDKVLLLHKNEGLGVNSFRVNTFVILEKALQFLHLILLNNFRNLLIFCSIIKQ